MVVPSITKCAFITQQETHLEVHGDSNMIIDARNGYASIITAPHLKEIQNTVNQIVANLAWTSWNHVKREWNKMADFMANVAMDTQSSRILDHTSAGTA